MFFFVLILADNSVAEAAGPSSIQDPSRNERPSFGRRMVLHGEVFRVCYYCYNSRKRPLAGRFSEWTRLMNSSTAVRSAVWRQNVVQRISLL